MPELPEVETVVRGLQGLAGLSLIKLEINDSRVWFESEADPEDLYGKRLLEVSRRGKYLLLRFEEGRTLVQHLRMTGKMLDSSSGIVPEEVRKGRGRKSGKGLQIRCSFRFPGKELWFFDTRRFGTLTLTQDEKRFFDNKKIAPDPILETEKAFACFNEKIGRSTKPMKTALLDQSIVAGVGNIYADEVLFAAGIYPMLPAHKLKEPDRIWREVLRILGESISLGGSTIRDYVNSNGTAGSFSELHKV